MSRLCLAISRSTYSDAGRRSPPASCPSDALCIHPDPSSVILQVRRRQTVQGCRSSQATTSPMAGGVHQCSPSTARKYSAGSDSPTVHANGSTTSDRDMVRTLSRPALSSAFAPGLPVEAITSERGPFVPTTLSRRALPLACNAYTRCGPKAVEVAGSQETVKGMHRACESFGRGVRGGVGDIRSGSLNAPGTGGKSGCGGRRGNHL